jgi:transposase-like protein
MMSMPGLSRQTSCDYISAYRELIANSLTSDDTMIGGDGIIVEIDESKFGKRKYHRGHRVEGVWVLGGIERTDAKKVFLVPVESRDSETLLTLIDRHVKPGSIIYTDMWAAYGGVRGLLGMPHFTVNHSKNFKDPLTGVHTNTIEGLWNGVKSRIRPRSRVKSGINMHFMEYIWRKKHSSSLWTSLLLALKTSFYGAIEEPDPLDMTEVVIESTDTNTPATDDATSNPK